MSQRTATIESLPMAFEVVKAMRADGLEWGEGYRPLGRQALAEIIQGRMAEAVDDWLDSLDGSAMRDRRNGSYSRHLLTELGDIELSVPRTRRFCPSEVLRSYARRAPEIDRAILAGFVLGLSTRKVGEVLLARLGRKVSASTVSRVAKTLDEAVAAFHARPLADRYKALMLDGVVLARRTGAGALKRPVLVALGIRADGKKEIIDFHLATGESARRAGPIPRSGSSPQPNTACVSCGEYPEPFSPPGRSCSSISVSSSFPSVTTMSQKSSVMQLPQFVPKALTSDRVTPRGGPGLLRELAHSSLPPTLDRPEAELPVF